VRSIEIFSSLEEGEERLRVYFMLFEASAEEKTFMKSLEREQNAFERLIHHKKTMPLPVHTLAGTTQEMQQAMASGSGVSGSYVDGTLPLSVDTRTGKGKARLDTERRDIAVDVREFRSALPSILHQGGMRLAPVTLTVGDFVLSNVHCVERKSISDLFGSFASGRLYTQAESMSKYYKCPCLLIEFDPAKSFCLQNSNELGVEIRTDSVCSKLCLLTMHFPQLRILWSRSPHETLCIFKALKANHDEVNVDRAMEIGRSEELDDTFVKEVEDDEEDEVNEAARDMLLRLPGVNVHNARNIMKECDSIAELAEMPRERLRKIAGPVTGQKLFTFFRQKMAAT
jgi:DNA excision repair protein ERCC-4